MERKGVQVIDGKGHFCLNCSNLETLVQSLGTNLCDNVHVVGIVGSQQEGKTTLLNNLFGTEFKTSTGTATSGMERCTDGILMAGSSSSSVSGRVLVFDVEGVDGMERPNNEELEGRFILFTLAIAEVLIFNMKYSDIGRMRGGNYALLEAVFQAAVKMDITHGEKTTLLFTLRDYNFAVKIPESLRKINENLENLWKNMKKPEAKKNAVIQSYFSVDVVGLPHLMPDDQPTTNRVALDALRRRFSTVGDNILGANKNYRNVRVFLQLLGRTWDLIKNNQVFGIFSIRKCIAMMDCDKASQVAQENLSKKAEDVIVMTETQKGVIDHRMECRNEKRRLEGLFMAQAPEEFREVYTVELKVLQEKMERAVEKFEREYDRVVDAAQTKRDLESQKNLQTTNSNLLKKMGEDLENERNRLKKIEDDRDGERKHNQDLIQRMLESQAATQMELEGLRKREIRREKIDEVLRGGIFSVVTKMGWYRGLDEGKMKVVNYGSYVEFISLDGKYAWQRSKGTTLGKGPIVSKIQHSTDQKWVITPRMDDYFTIGCPDCTNVVCAVDTMNKKFIMVAYSGGSFDELFTFERV